MLSKYTQNVPLERRYYFLRRASGKVFPQIKYTSLCLCKFLYTYSTALLCLVNTEETITTYIFIRLSKHHILHPFWLLSLAICTCAGLYGGLICDPQWSFWGMKLQLNVFDTFLSIFLLQISEGGNYYSRKLTFT